MQNWKENIQNPNVSIHSSGFLHLGDIPTAIWGLGRFMYFASFQRDQDFRTIECQSVKESASQHFQRNSYPCSTLNEWSNQGYNFLHMQHFPGPSCSHLSKIYFCRARMPLLSCLLQRKLFCMTSFKVIHHDHILCLLVLLFLLSYILPCNLHKKIKYKVIASWSWACTGYIVAVPPTIISDAKIK